MKLNFTLILILFAFVCFGQMSSFKEDATKHYDDGKSITYFTISGFEDKEQTYFLESRFVENENVLRFEVLNTGGKTKQCFVEYFGDLSTLDIVVKLNELNENYKLKSKSLKTNYPSFIKWVYNITGFPKFKNIDKVTYYQQRQIWIDNNRKLYKKIDHLDIDIFSQD